MKKEYSKAIYYDISALVVLCLVGLVFTLDLAHCVDIGLYDETNYLWRGLNLPDVYPGAQSAPLYSLWYYGLSHLATDPLDLYYLNYRLMVVIPTITFYLALRAYGVGGMIAYFFSIGLLVSAANFPVWPKVSHFLLAIFLAGFVCIALAKDNNNKLFILLIISFICSYIRPEFFVAVYLFLAMFLSWSVFEFVNRNKIYFQVDKKFELVKTDFMSYRGFKGLGYAVLLLLGGIVYLILGSPLDGERGMIAFGQHFSINYVSWSGDTQNPWTNWERIVEGQFGPGISSPFEALLANPISAFHHVMLNIVHFPTKTMSMFGQVYPPSYIKGFGGCLIVMALMTYCVVRRRSQYVASVVKTNFKELQFDIVLIGLFLSPVMFSILLIAPREHYLLVFWVVIGVLVLAILFSEHKAFIGQNYSYGLFLMFMGLSLLLVGPSSYASCDRIQPNLKTILALRGENIEGGVNILEAEGGYGVYLGKNYRRIAEYDKNQPFDEFLSKQNINLIVLSTTLLGDVRFVSDPQWKMFLENHLDLGFEAHMVPGVENQRVLLIKKDLTRTKN